ncbi:MAG: hypothetical protein IT320_16745 [Anaerolineae bacterium]|nr:hypothetical protein [Anaerolineae bacterium]
MTTTVGTARLCPPIQPYALSFTRRLAAIAIALCLSGAAVSRAQAVPNVSILLSQMTAHEGETVTAQIFINDIANLGGADVGIHVDETCLRIVDRPAGDLLPDADGGFTAFSSLDEHNARLALAITDRSRLANGGGVFYRLNLLVTCAAGTAPLEITFAELSSYVDPAAEQVELRSYTMSAGTLNVVNTQLQIGPVDQQSQQPATPTLDVTPTLETVSVPQPESTTNSLNMVIVVVLLCLSLLIVIVMVWLARRFLRRTSS